jgi:hypothetical protein
MKKINRNDLCSCGSGKKYKKCCLERQASGQSYSWAEDDGIHFINQGPAPSPERLAEMTKEYQKRIRNSPLWDEMVNKFGKEKAEEMLKECKAELRQ